MFTGLPNLSLMSSALRRGGGASGPWTPAQITSSLYYDPSDQSSFWMDTAGTSPVTADDQQWARMDDLSGNGRHQLQAVSASRPRWQDDGSITLDGSDDESVATFSAGTLPAMASVIFAINTGDAVSAPFFDAVATRFFLVLQSGNTSSATSSGGTPSYYKNNTLIPSPNRDVLATAIATGAWMVVEVRDAKLDLNQSFGLSTASTLRMGGALGRIVVVPNGTELTDNRLNILNWCGAPHGLSF